jgi:hypothetical protein
MRPRAMILFERLYMVRIAIGIVAGFLIVPHLSVFIAPQGAPVAAGYLVPAIAVGSVLIGIVINLLLLYFIARRRSEVAKWIFIILFALGAIGLIRSLEHGGGMVLGWSHGLSAVDLLIELAMLWLLFRPETKTWFARANRRSMGYSDDFR